MILKAYFAGRYNEVTGLTHYGFLVMKAGETDAGEILYECSESITEPREKASQIRAEYIALGRCLAYIWERLPAGIVRLDVFGCSMRAISEVNGVWLVQAETESLRDRCREIMLEIATKSGKQDYPRLAYIPEAKNGLAVALLEPRYTT